MSTNNMSHLKSETKGQDTKRLPTIAMAAHQHPYEYLKGLSLVATLFALALGTFLMALDTTIITVAVPKIATQFNALDQVGWIGSAYLITLTAFQPISGSFYKSFDPKILYMSYIVIFEVGSTLCAVAPKIEVFILGRAIAGVGAAGLLQGALGIITFISALETRPIHMAVVISVFGISSSIGPILGGVFTDKVSWRWCFYINLPMGSLAFFLVVLFMHLERTENNPDTRSTWLKTLKSIDFMGVTLLLGLVSCLCIALQDGGSSRPWDSPRIIGLLVGFVLLKVLFWVWQWRLGEDALIPVRFLRQRTVAFGSAFLFCDNMSNYLKLYYMPFYFQSVRGTSAIRSGVDYIALAVPQFFALLIAGGLVTRFGHYMPVILTGQIICAIGTGLLTRVDIATPTAHWATFLALTGFGLGMGINAPHIAIQAVMETESDVFLANGVATFFSQLGGTIAVPIGNAFLLNAIRKYVPRWAPDVPVQTVIRAGPLSIDHLSQSADTVHAIRLVYSTAIKHIMIYALTVVCVSLPVACGMQWLNIREVSQERNTENSPVAVKEDGNATKVA
ncbi:MFS general substrate transporter [Karstenula rhodostoma CBS 690.94]|uniref:MFS general substrate transporter n=1 Tax=Karstenula rhodostoma CBS 690.94 TaxID=1392251 RepID=A0A9P4UJB6_9PLEO|nr:MFS general substrate transporter [Karstenula rhodostoma CBS 690.94]